MRLMVGKIGAVQLKEQDMHIALAPHALIEHCRPSPASMKQCGPQYSRAKRKLDAARDLFV